MSKIFLLTKFILEDFQVFPSLEKQLINLRFLIFSKNSIFTLGGFFSFIKYFSSGYIFLYLKGRVLTRVLNLSILP